MITMFVGKVIKTMTVGMAFFCIYTFPWSDVNLGRLSNLIMQALLNDYCLQVF